MNNAKVLNGIEKDIKELVYGYVAQKSFTYSEDENQARDFIINYLSEIPYFKEHPQYYGAYDIEGDPFGRSVCYAMVKGEGSKTVVLVHHNDIVTVEDFKLLKDYAFSPDELEEKLMHVKDSLPEEAREDLESGGYLFCRGGCDMKAGGSIQFSLLKRYSELEDFKGNVIVIAVPDEENLSAGMRAAVKLLSQLKAEYNLDYQMMINSEPHQRKKTDEGIFSEGSVGKIMPFIYVRGYLSHIGKVFEGFNPLNLMAEIVRRTELNMDFSDVVGDESAPPPTWLYLKDSKSVYDVSMPLSASGCFSILTLNQSPAAVIDKVHKICEDSFDKILEDMNRSYERFSAVAEPVIKSLPWKKKVMSFGELYNEAYDLHGEAFKESYEKKLESLAQQLKNGEVNIIESNFALLEMVFDYIDDLAPRVIHGLIPPYYPNVSNIYFEGIGDRAGLYEMLDNFTKEQFGQHYTREYFYTGISDLSYTSVKDGKAVSEKLNEYMPLFGSFYDIPFEAIEDISMPCINIGPWGKDFHKMTERVYKEDLYHRTPVILNKAITELLK